MIGHSMILGLKNKGGITMENIENSGDEAPVKKSNMFVKLWPIFAIIAAVVVFISNGWHEVLTLETLRERREVLLAFVQENMLIAVLAYIGIYIVATVVMTPGAGVLTIAGGFLFGLVTGSILTVIGATLGASTLFFAAKSSVGSILREKAGPFVSKMEEGFKQDAWSYMFALRFIPAVPYPVANIAPAIFGAKYSQYAITTMLGIIPGVIAYTWIGSGLGATFDAGENPDLAGVAKNLIPALVALGVVALIPVAWKKFGPKSAVTADSE